MHRTLIFALWLFCIPALATTYYVRTDGNDANDGLSNTAGGAWLTIQHAEDTMQAGDITLVQAGTYAETVTVNTRDGSAGNFRRFSGSGTDCVVTRWLVSDRYTWIDGFKVLNTATNTTGVAFTAASDQSVLSNCWVQCRGSAVTVVYASGPTNLWIVSNTITNCQKGIVINGGQSHTIKSNILTDPIEWTLDSDTDHMRILSGGNHVVMWNTLYGMNTNHVDTTDSGNHADGIQTFNESAGEAPVTNLVIACNFILDCMTCIQATDALANGNANWTITNNVFGRGLPIIYSDQLTGQSPLNWTAIGGTNLIRNNTWFGMGASAVFLNCGTITLENNISLDTGSGYSFTGTTPVAGDYNCTHPTASPDAGANDITDDPLVVDASNPFGADGLAWTPDDGLRLTSGSPAIAVSGPDWGAYEYASPPGIVSRGRIHWRGRITTR